MEPTRRRSIFADRLTPFAGFAFGDDTVATQRGRWATFFRDRVGPSFTGRVVLEIGCSDGEFLSRLAVKHPTTAFIGLDWKYKSLVLAAGRVERMGLRNVALLRGRGQELATMFGPGEVDEVLLFHPDPFAEPRELHNRLFAEPFLVDAHTLLRDGVSTLTLKTDHSGYYAWALALFGMAEPAHFESARARAEADATTATRLLGEPRIRASELLPPAHRPDRSESAIRRFSIAASSADFWHDATILRHTSSRVFAGERTFFEQRFYKKRQPIYYFELSRNT